MLNDYTKRTFVNGVTTVNPATFQPMENKIDELDHEKNITKHERHDMKYYYDRNVVDINYFTSLQDWNIGAGTIEHSYSGLMGSIKVEEDDNVAGFLNTYRTGLSLDLTKFYNNDSSDTNDYIVLHVYISDHNQVDTGSYGVIVNLGADSGNYYSFQFTSGLTTGWNTLKAKKSAYTSTVGSPSWSNIDRIAIGWSSLINSSGDYVLFNVCQLIRANSVSNDIDCFMESKDGAETTNIITTNSGQWTIVKSNNNIGAYNFYVTNTYNMLQYSVESYDFIASMIVICKNGNYLSRLRYRIDANNYIDLYMGTATSRIYCNVVDGGVSDSNYLENFTITFNHKYEFLMIRNSTSVMCMIRDLDDMENCAIFHRTCNFTQSEKGVMYIGTADANVEDIILDMNISVNKTAYRATIAQYALNSKKQSNSGNFTTSDYPSISIAASSDHTLKVPLNIIASHGDIILKGNSTEGVHIKFSTLAADATSIDSTSSVFRDATGYLSGNFFDAGGNVRVKDCYIQNNETLYIVFENTDGGSVHTLTIDAGKWTVYE